MSTTAKTANMMRSASTSGVRHGPNQKHVVQGGSSKAVSSQTNPGKLTGPIKGTNRGGC